MTPARDGVPASDGLPASDGVPGSDEAGSEQGASTEPVPAARRASDWVDRLLGSDPGLNRLRSALMTVLTVGATLGVEWLFVRGTGALLRPVPPPHAPAAAVAAVHTANHALYVVAMLAGAVVGLVSSLGVMDPTPRALFQTMVFLPVPMVATLALGLEIGGHRAVALTSVVVFLAVGTYLRRFGTRGFAYGMMLFVGDFFGIFLHGAVGIGQIGWIVAEVGLGLGVALVVRFALFFPNPARELARTQRSYAARARKVAAVALEQFDGPPVAAHHARQLESHLIRLNEAALMIDAYIGDPGGSPEGASGRALRQQVFDVELSLTNIARSSTALAASDVSPATRDQVRLMLLDLSGGTLSEARNRAAGLLDGLPASAGDDRAEAGILHRLGRSVVTLADAEGAWTAPGRGGSTEAPAFKPSMGLVGGWLPGSAAVSAAASLEAGGRGWDRVRLAPYTRAAIQMAVAAGASTALGDLVSPRHYYWAVIATFITFMGTNNVGEQVRKAIFRMAGTLLGVLAGSGLVSLIGTNTAWSITVILVALFLGFYLIRVNYTFMVVAVTVMVSQLYKQLGEFSNALLWLRVRETALGAAVSVAVVLLVVPLRSRRVGRVALRNHFSALAVLVDHAGARLVSADRPVDAARLRADARALDSSYQALVATAVPLWRTLDGRIHRPTATALATATASRDCGRNLAVDAEDVAPLGAADAADVADGLSVLGSGIDTLTQALTGGQPQGPFVRSAPAFVRVGRRMASTSPVQDEALLTLSDLALLDHAMAELAGLLDLVVADDDPQLHVSIPGGAAPRTH